jgi:tRNA(Ile)-lysidine synthetase-like protein
MFRLVPDPDGAITLRAGEVLQAAWRRGGERCLQGGKHRMLKKVFQESGVPPWWRQHLPLFYRGAELVAVADLWTAQRPGDDGRVGADTDAGAGDGITRYRVHWQRPQGASPPRHD